MIFNMDDYTASVKQIIYRSFVKYERLQTLVYETFSNSSISEATELDIYIDLYSVLKPLFSEHSRTRIEDYTELTTEIVNMCAHYRYFFKKLSVATRFYLVWSYNTCDINRKFVSEYNSVFYSKSQIKIFKDFVNNNLDLMEILIPYLPDIFLIRSQKDYESSIIISALIDKNNRPSLIITHDIYPLQVTAYNRNTALLYPKKVRGAGDESIMIPINEKVNYRHEFWKLLADTNMIKIKEELMDVMSPLNFTLFSALNGLLCRNIKPLYSVVQSVKLLYYLAKDEDLKISPEQLYNDVEIVNTVPVSIVEARYNAIDINYIKPFYIQDPEYLSLKFDNLRDDSAVNHINAKFFANNPIDINKL